MRWLGIVLMVAVLAGWWFREPLAECWKRQPQGGRELRTKSAQPKPDPAAYAALIQQAKMWREDLSERFAEAQGEPARALVIKDARTFLDEALPAMMRCWLGTPWDFNGTSETPGSEGIACGYFVSTVLRDAGFDLDRYKLAQQPSEGIMRSFVEKDALELVVGRPYQRYSAELAKRQPGIYLLGLDTHVAFVVVRDGEFRVIHSSGSRPWRVVDEAPEEAEVVRRSNWRMLGPLTGDDEVLVTWLTGARIQVHGT